MSGVKSCVFSAATGPSTKHSCSDTEVEASDPKPSAIWQAFDNKVTNMIIRSTQRHETLNRAVLLGKLESDFNTKVPTTAMTEALTQTRSETNVKLVLKPALGICGFVQKQAPNPVQNPAIVAT